jgi:manganese transport protein
MAVTQNMINWNRIKQYLKFFGPAWLVMLADMDASSTIGAAETGAIFKYGLIWFMLVLIVPLYLIQEVSGRIGVATEKGLGEVIRENYPRKTALFLTVPMVITDMVTYAIEYLGIAIGVELLGLPILLSLPLFFVAHLLIVTHRKYGTTEMFLVAISSVLIVAFIATLIVRGIEPYSPVLISASPNFLFILAVNVGAVVMPFMLFFQTSATAEKVTHVRSSFKEYNTGNTSNLENEKYFKKTAMRSMRIETLFGAIVSEMLMIIVEMTMSGVSPSTDFASVSELAGALSVIAGNLSPYLFGIGLIGAAFLALVVISLGSAWGFVEVLGIKRDRATWVYVIESLPALIAAMIIPTTMLINAVLTLLVLFVFVLIGPAVVMGLLARKKSLMKGYVTSGRGEIAYWISVMFVVSFGIIAIL